MSEVIETISKLSEQFKVTIRPKSLDEYKDYLYKIKTICIGNEIEPENIYVYYFLKEKYPYLTCKDMATIMQLSMSNYSQRKEKWIFEIKTYDDVKQNIDKIKPCLR